MKNDLIAEHVVAACAVDNAHAARLAHGRLVPDDFLNPLFKEMFSVAAGLGCTSWEDRIGTAAVHLGQDAVEFKELVMDRPVMADETGSYAARVAAAARSRRLALAMAHAVDDLDAGADADEVLARLQEAA